MRASRRFRPILDGLEYRFLLDGSGSIPTMPDGSPIPADPMNPTIPIIDVITPDTSDPMNPEVPILDDPPSSSTPTDPNAPTVVSASQSTQAVS